MLVRHIYTSIVIVIAWGINPILTKYGSQLSNVEVYMVMTSILYTIGVVTFNSAAIPGLWRQMYNHLSSRLIVVACIDGVLCLALPFYLYNILLVESDSMAVVITVTWCSAPILTTVLSYFIYNQTLTWIQIGGIFITLTGIFMLMINIGGNSNNNNDHTSPSLPTYSNVPPSHT